MNENKTEYEVINLGYEYPGMTGGVKWAIVTDLEKEDLEAKYGDEIMAYRPYVLMSVEQGEAFHEYDRNENKHDMRRMRHHDLWGYEEGTTEYYHSVFSNDEPEEAVLGKLDREMLMAAIEQLPEKQRRRCKLYFILGLTEEEIADVEGISHQMVSMSINKALLRLRKIIKK
jgi:RNA polymerase sigma factor (sigma-70 family)